MKKTTMSNTGGGTATLPDYSQPATALKPITAKTLLKSGLVGMWKDRKDIGDSEEFATTLRQRAQTRRVK